MDHKDRARSASISTYGERALHATLKNYYEPDSGRHEQPCCGFIADIINESGIIEIQTSGFNKIRKKLETFLAVTTVTVVFPAERQKWLIWMDPTSGEVTKKRRSPKTGTPYAVFRELYKIKYLLTHPNLKIIIIMIDIEEYRRLDGWSSDKKKGSTRFERIPTDIGEEIVIANTHDYKKLIPGGMPEIFTSQDYAAASKLSRSAAQTALNVLSAVDAVSRCGKIGRSIAYKID